MSAPAHKAAFPDEGSKAPLTQVGTYALVRRLGSGGMGEVWLGQQAVSGGLGAVKRVRPGARGQWCGFLQREGRAIARLCHPHIVPLFEVGVEHLVTAFIDGTNLERRLQAPIDARSAVRIIRQIASALGHAHGRGVVHGDVKPANILLDRSGNAYLADFGVARLLDDEDNRWGGTPAFMAPEQLRGEPAAPAADQYALGRTLLEMLIGVEIPVFGAAAALSELPTDLPPALRSAVIRAMATDPADRFPAVQDLAETLANIDLAAVSPPARLANPQRSPELFRWCAAARATQSVGANLDARRVPPQRFDRDRARGSRGGADIARAKRTRRHRIFRLRLHGATREGD